MQEKKVEEIVDKYRNRSLNRRDFLTRLVAITGSLGAAHLLLEQNGLANTLISDIESAQIEVNSESVTYPSANGVTAGGYLSSPKKDGKFPAILVIHENRGLNEHTRDVARRFAAEGFVALAVDILARKGGTGSFDTPEKIREIFGTITADEAITDLKAGLTFLNSHTKVNQGKLGSVGFCWGGARSFLLAAESELLKSAVVFYGSAPTPEKLAQVRVPVLGLYGETDTRITAAVPAVAETLKTAGKEFEYKVYPGAGHAFFNDGGERYNAEAAKDAWAKTLTFFRTKLA